ncbi:MAG: PHP domain-containing protein [Candidatus Omnitrophica bacterium]|nr:PHP domain-containing protein [Candidatus Omnitrophota bacterium]
MKKYADLHIHTTNSDGTLTPEEAIAYARKKGFCCIALCDHDCISTLEQAEALGKAHEIEIIPAIEITAQEGERELHILGYFMDSKNKKLNDMITSIRENRIERLDKIVSKLKEHNIGADAKEIIEFAGQVALSRLHIARYMVKKGFVASLGEAFAKYIGDHGPCYVSNFKFSSKDVIDTIKDAHGISVIAHPGLNGVEFLLPLLARNNIDGIEVYHSDHGKTTASRLEKFAQENGLLVTGGSDCHGIHNKERLIGKIKLPYEYVEKLKIYAQSRNPG